MRMRIIAVYAALLLGAVLFAWPFIWMAMTSVKLERELFSEYPARLPEAPRPVVRSPYIDERLFADVDGSRREETLALIAANLHSGVYSWPNDVDADRMITETARGIYQH